MLCSNRVVAEPSRLASRSGLTRSKLDSSSVDSSSSLGRLSILGHLTAKSDAYSFGVVLLEMLSGRRAVNNNHPSGEPNNLVEWARLYLKTKKKFFRILDSRLEGIYDFHVAFEVFTLAFQCLSPEPNNRPSMEEVVRMLEVLKEFSIRSKTKKIGCG